MAEKTYPMTLEEKEKLEKRTRGTKASSSTRNC